MAKARKTTEKRGGARPGAGAPIKSLSPVVKTAFSLPAHLVEALNAATAKQAGAYNRSGLVAKILAKALKVKL